MWIIDAPRKQKQKKQSVEIGMLSHWGIGPWESFLSTTSYVQYPNIQHPKT